jgi:hypothetical protein
MMSHGAKPVKENEQQKAEQLLLLLKQFDDDFKQARKHNPEFKDRESTLERVNRE